MDYNRMDINLLTGDSGQRPRRSVLMALFDACAAYALAWNDVIEARKAAFVLADHKNDVTIPPADRLMLPPISDAMDKVRVLQDIADAKHAVMIKALEEAHQDAAGANDFRYR